MGKNKITISDIAEAAGVSKATVSYVLNKRQSGFKISIETQLRVLEICTRLQYKRDEVAVLLANCRKNPVQLLVLSPWLYSQFSDFMVQVNAVLHRRENENKLNVIYNSYSNDELDKVLRNSVIKKYDAILLLGTSRNDDKWLTRHQGKMSNVILVNRNLPGFHSVYGNDTNAMLQLLGKVDLNHYRNFAAFTTSRNSYCERCRHSGFSRGTAGADRNFFTFTNAYETAWKNVSELMQKISGPLLVFLPSYVPAAQLLKSALDAGIKVPEDLGIITYDHHSLLSKFVSPELTTVNPRLEKIADAGVDIACALRNDQSIKNAIIEAELNMGKTVLFKTEIQGITIQKGKRES